MRLAVVALMVSALLPSLAQAQAPVAAVLQDGSSVKFSVKASVDGTFDKWDATLTFGSTAVESGILDVKIQAASVNTGSGMKDGKLKSKDFFDAEHDPLITFHSTKIIETGPASGEIDGEFTIRGVTKAEKLFFETPPSQGSPESSDAQQLTPGLLTIPTYAPPPLDSALPSFPKR
jgi:polyisoprenoid-binding protein YceI